VTVIGGPSTGASALGEKLTLGRSSKADVVLDDPRLSELHVELTPHDGGITVSDLDTLAGTFFEGARLGRAVVPRGATLSLGGSTVVVDAATDGERAPASSESFRALLGKSEPMRKVVELLQRLAPTDLAVFVEGPTGSGKELVARALHDASPRASRPFVVLDCAAIPATLAESVLFGHAAGSFTGAFEQRMGVFEAADGGTVFLDEVGDLPLDLQPKLLRVLEQQRVTRIGENRSRPVSVRVVSATWRQLRGMVGQGAFRDDLYFRLAQTRVVVPSLSERRDDIELLVAEFLRRLPRDAACARSASPAALEALAARDWPGNVRELKNTIERAAYMARGAVIEPNDFVFEEGIDSGEAPPVSARPSAPTSARPPSNEIPEFKVAKRTVVDDFESSYLERLMAKTSGNIAMAAGLAGIERHYLRSLLKKHGLHTRD
jgi:DNA-binding NtrC family response regulator